LPRMGLVRAETGQDKLENAIQQDYSGCVSE
jgi:hypothetical protein